MECDFNHTKDYRHLRVEFGPSGRIDTFSGFAVLEYVMASCSPWPEYKELKEFLASKDRYRPGSPNNYLSGSFDKLCVLEEELWRHKFLEVADPELCKLVEKCTAIDDDGIATVGLPESTTYKEFIDSLVCNRWIISAKGKNQIQKHQT